MQIDIGRFYFIKDSFFDSINDPGLMQNKENGKKRPCYYCFKSEKYENINWFIPISTKTSKYQKIYAHKIEKQIQLGKKPSIDTIVFGNVADTFSAFLIQNMFPVTQEYVKEQYIKNKVVVRLPDKLQTEIISKANKVLKLYKYGMKNIIFSDVDKILNQLLSNNT